MPIRFDAATDYLYRTAGLPSYNGFTIMGWLYISVDRNASSSLFLLYQDGSNFVGVTLTTDGTTLLTYVPSGAVGGSTLSTGTWYHVALVTVAGVQAIYLNGAGNALGFSATAPTVPVALYVGSDSANFLNGRLAHLKCWSAALSAEEIASEMLTIRPQRTLDLHGFWPTWPGSGERVKDYSGNGRDWTENGTLADEDPAPVSWGAPAWQIIRPASAPATSGTARVTGFSRLAGQGAKGAALPGSLYVPSRLAGAGAKAATNTAEVRAPGRFATVALKGGIAVAAVRSAGRLATAFVKGGLTTLAQRAAGLLASAGVHAGTGTGSARAGGLLASTGAHAGTTAAGLRSGGRLAALSSTARLTVAAITAPARLALQAAKASTATASERAPARLATLATTARSAAALLTALASQVASSVPTFSQGAAFVARARMTASSVKSSLSAVVQAARGDIAAAGAKAATGQGQLSGSARAAADTRRDAFAVAVLRAQPSLSVVGVVGRAGSVALYARGRGAVVVSVALQHGSLELLDRLVGGLDVVDRLAGGMDATDRSVGGLEVSDQ